MEITEYSFAESVETTISNIKTLRDLGVQIALDDFGTGYTSIKQLITLPINVLKIDKSLIDDIENSQDMRDIVDSVIYMGHIMNCEVISEGVEKDEQIEILREHKCDFIQGFVWGKPLPFEEAKALCK
jgi:EAL domain-containing protein (putative c-di-GMP-specific phosphodiesterase class I)